jgi:hypothetical protein
MVLSDELAALRLAVAEAARASFADLKREHGREHFYVFALYTEPMLGYVGPSANTEEALARDGARGERWTPQAWSYHGEGRDHFERANALLRALEGSQGASEDAQDLVWRGTWSAFLEALETLDRERTFGTGAARDTILVSALWGDKDVVVFLEAAERLNPRAPFLEYLRDMLPALKSHVAESARYPAAREAHERAKILLARLERSLGDQS